MTRLASRGRGGGELFQKSDSAVGASDVQRQQKNACFVVQTTKHDRVASRAYFDCLLTDWPRVYGFVVANKSSSHFPSAAVVAGKPNHEFLRLESLH